uniref:RNA/RNP complex-1-interacting phosphatase n=1 Tax=Sus scrofa TaxID=9823 RepID=A0A8D1EQV7_PIG
IQGKAHQSYLKQRKLVALPCLSVEDIFVANGIHSRDQQVVPSTTELSNTPERWCRKGPRGKHEKEKGSSGKSDGGVYSGEGPLDNSIRAHESFEKKLTPEERFSPLDLFNKIQEQNEKLGLIIDLTYTRRYYKPEDLPETIRYLKIYTVGHHVPDDKTIFKFKCAVDGFLKENKDNDRLIGVHCTHGLNRTGYLICRYLIDVEGMKPDDAIELFNRSRGHCIERQNYIEDLQSGPIRKKFSQHRNTYQRSRTPPPGPPGEDHFQRRYSWNVKPNTSHATQNKRWYSSSYHRPSYPKYYG